MTAKMSKLADRRAEEITYHRLLPMVPMAEKILKNKEIAEMGDAKTLARVILTQAKTCERSLQLADSGNDTTSEAQN